MTLPLFDKAPSDLPARLVNALRLGNWIHREQLARMLECSVRQVRDAASHANGEVLSSQLGLRLTCCATEDEINEALGRFASQITEMQRRMAETRGSWNDRELNDHKQSA